MNYRHVPPALALFFSTTALEGSDRTLSVKLRAVDAAPSLLPNDSLSMRIFGAVGLGLTLIVLQLLVPKVFAALEETLLKFFGLAQLVLDQVHASVIRGGF